MVQALLKTKPVTFAEFIEWKPEGKRYELHRGVIVEMNQPVGKHEDIVCFLNERITSEYLRLNLPYGIPRTVLVKPPESESAYLPDVLVLNRPHLVNEPLWEKTSTVTQGGSICLVIEVISTAVASSRGTRPTINWRVDYLTKAGDYEEMGIPEYWIVDHLGLGGRRFIGSPKQPTISVYKLIDGEYQVNQFQGDDRIVSLIFPELSLTAHQIFQSNWLV
jgi:Uma2 family endonuclease